MKKTYIKPEANIFDVELNNIIATSLGVDDSVEVPDDGEKSREVETPSRPNIWEQVWLSLVGTKTKLYNCRGLRNRVAAVSSS